MSYFAAAVVRGSKGWTATVLNLDGVADLEEIGDRLREVSADSAVSLLFVESDDSYLAVLRLDDGEDLRVFGSDGTFAEESRLGAILLSEVGESTLDSEDELDETSDGEKSDLEDVSVISPDTEPVGDPDLLSDLGVSAHRLLHLCAREGLLPSDVTAEVCQAIGCGDEVEELREA